jgi:hypothetical protein
MGQPLGLDLSSHNHPNDAEIDYQTAAQWLFQNSGGATPFVIVKATEADNYVNPWFAKDVAGFRSHGCNVGAYLFDAGGTAPGTEQATFARVAGGLPDVLDVEYPQGLDPARYGAHTATALGLDPDQMVYLNRSELGSFPGAPWGHRLWLAAPDVPGEVGYGASIHQLNAQAVPGCVGLVDLNRWEGDLGDYSTFFATGAPVGGVSPPTVPDPSPQPSPAPTPGPNRLELAMQGWGNVSRNDTVTQWPVKKVQGLLDAYGYQLAIDGVFGPRTDDAVRDFQSHHGCVVDGIVGPETIGHLVAD